MKKIIIQFNEANFDLIKKYSIKYKLDGFLEILNFKSMIKTTSENEYSKLEPWIQWYSFYSAKSYKDHQVFHLGDSKNIKEENFVDDISKSQRVGCFGSMNLSYNEKFNIFISDPWSRNKNDNSISSKFVYKAIEQLINSNNRFQISMSSIIGIILMIGFPNNSHKIKIIFLSILSFFKKDRASLVGYFDYFFFNYAIKRSVKENLDFSMVFLNGLAHIQHRFMMNSQFIKDEDNENIERKDDEILRVLKIYDNCFKRFFKTFRDKSEIWFITALTQKAYKKKKTYWRFKNHKELLKNFFNFEFIVDPLMTRDFKIKCDDFENFEKICNFLNDAKIIDNDDNILCNAFGYIDQINKNVVFSTFIMDSEDKNLKIKWGEITVEIDNEIEFVAHKNGEHSQEGWAFTNISCSEKELPIWKLNSLVKKNSVDH